MIKDQSLNRLKKISNNTVATSLNFTTAQEIKTGEIASILLNGKVKSLEVEKSINGTFMDSIAIDGSKFLVIYFRSNESKSYSLFAKFIDITTFGISTLSEEIDLGLSETISEGDRFTLVKEPNGSRIVLFKIPTLALQARIGFEAIGKGESNLPLLLTISGVSIQTDTIQDATSISLSKTLMSVTTHVGKSKFMVAYSDGIGVTLSSLQLNTISEEITSYTFTETSSISVLDSYIPVSLTYDSINQKICVTSIVDASK